MDRRRLLGVIGASAVAGCLGSESDNSEPSEDSPPPDDDRQAGEPTADTTVTSSEVVTREAASGAVEAAVTGTVENTGDVRFGAVTAAGKFYNDGGQLLSTSQWGIRDFAPGEVWEPWLPYNGDTDRVERADLTITQAVEYGRTVSPDGFRLGVTDLQVPVDDYAMPRVVGEAVNESGEVAEILQARPKVYAENGNLLETSIRSTQQVGAGESWPFDIQVTFNNGSWKDRIGEYDVVLTR